MMFSLDISVMKRIMAGMITARFLDDVQRI